MLPRPLLKGPGAVVPIGAQNTTPSLPNHAPPRSQESRSGEKPGLWNAATRAIGTWSSKTFTQVTGATPSIAQLAPSTVHGVDHSTIGASVKVFDLKPVRPADAPPPTNMLCPA